MKVSGNPKYECVGSVKVKSSGTKLQMQWCHKTVKWAQKHIQTYLGYENTIKKQHKSISVV